MRGGPAIVSCMYLLCADLALSHVQAFPEPAPVAYVCDLVFINFTPCVPLVGGQERGKDIDEINQVGVSITLFRKNFYRGQLFNFCFRSFFYLKILLLEMLIAFLNPYF